MKHFMTPTVNIYMTVCFSRKRHIKEYLDPNPYSINIDQAFYFSFHGKIPIVTLAHIRLLHFVLIIAIGYPHRIKQREYGLREHGL